MDGQKCDEKEKTQSLKRLEIVYLYLCESSPLGYQTVSSQVVDVYCVASVRDKELRRRGNTLFDCKDSKQKAISHFAYFIFLSVRNYYSLAKTLTLGLIKKQKNTALQLPCAEDAPWAHCAAVTQRKPMLADECAAGEC